MLLEKIIDSVYHSIVVAGLLLIGGSIGGIIAILCIPLAVDWGII